MWKLERSPNAPREHRVRRSASQLRSALPFDRGFLVRRHDVIDAGKTEIAIPRESVTDDVQLHDVRISQAIRLSPSIPGLYVIEQERDDVSVSADPYRRTRLLPHNSIDGLDETALGLEGSSRIPATQRKTLPRTASRLRESLPEFLRSTFRSLSSGSTTRSIPVLFTNGSIVLRVRT